MQLKSVYFADSMHRASLLMHRLNTWARFQRVNHVKHIWGLTVWVGMGIQWQRMSVANEFAGHFTYYQEATICPLQPLRKLRSNFQVEVVQASGWGFRGWFLWLCTQTTRKTFQTTHQESLKYVHIDSHRLTDSHSNYQQAWAFPHGLPDVAFRGWLYIRQELLVCPRVWDFEIGCRNTCHESHYPQFSFGSWQTRYLKTFKERTELQAESKVQVASPSLSPKGSPTLILSILWRADHGRPCKVQRKVVNHSVNQ